MFKHPIIQFFVSLLFFDLRIIVKNFLIEGGQNYVRKNFNISDGEFQKVAKFVSAKGLGENDKGDIDVADVISLLTLFNLDKYPDINFFPVIAYSGRKKCIDYYIAAHKDNEENKLANPYYRMRSIMLDIFKLYDQLEVNIGSYYKQKNSSGKYGSIKGVSVPKGDSKFKSKFYKTEMKYQSPTGFLYPILGAFRALVKDDGIEYIKYHFLFKFSQDLGGHIFRHIKHIL